MHAFDLKPRTTISAVPFSPGSPGKLPSRSILLLQERGRLKGHSPISRYLCSLPAARQPIPSIKLLTHTSGIPNYISSPEIARLDRTGATPRQMSDLVADKPLDFPPGTNWSASNTGYILLGMIVEKISGQSYADIRKTNIFAPLGMPESG